MNVGIGIDFVDHEEVRRAMQVHGRRYLERVYTRRELQECAGDAPKLAARFAVKEATMKALRGPDEPIDWRSIELRHGESGAPWLQITGAAAGLARGQGLGVFSVSVTQTSSSAAAVVLAQR